MITELSLAGHDSELFSFLDREYIEQLQTHPSAGSALWTFGSVVGEQLTGVASWNTHRFPLTQALVFTSRPTIDAESGRWPNCRELAELDGLAWIAEAIDFQLERLSFIRANGLINQQQARVASTDPDGIARSTNSDGNVPRLATRSPNSRGRVRFPGCLLQQRN